VPHIHRISGQKARGRACHEAIQRGGAARIMESLQFNKYAGAILGALGLTLGLNLFSDAVFSHAELSKPGYDLPGAEPEGGAKAEAGAPAESLAKLFSTADVSKGQADIKVCQACHNFEKGAGAKVGPPLYGVVGRAKGSVAGFDYSDGMKAKGGNWTFEDLNSFITSPKAYVSGTKMAYGGEANAQKRADIIDYLHTLSDKPEPLPTEAAK
jgi:cytochrome c